MPVKWSQEEEEEMNGEGPDPRDLALVEDGRMLAAVMPALEGEVARMDRDLEKRVFMELRAGTLTPERALDAWCEKHAYRRLIDRLTKHIRAGTTAAYRVSPHMGGGKVDA